jgi:uncharacterized protein DUF6159
MFDRIAMGWRLGMAALGVLRSDKKLLVFPLLSGICCLMVLLSFAAPLYYSQRFRDLVDQQQGADDAVWYVILFCFYVVNYFVIIFFNSALVSCALMRFGGMEPTIGDGLRAAGGRLPQILAWSLVSATVGVILKVIEDRSEKVGQFVAGVLGMAWGIMTYFVTPLLVVEKVGPIDAVKRSCALMKKAWGESLAANFGAGVLIFLLFLAALIPAVLGAVIGGVAAIVGIAVTVLLVILVSLISSAVNTIIVAALYEYAACEKAPAEFDVDLLHGAFATR